MTESGEVEMENQLDKLRNDEANDEDEVNTLRNWAAGRSETESEVELGDSFTEPEIEPEPRDGAESRGTLCSFTVLPSDVRPDQVNPTQDEVRSISESTGSNNK